jgi:hypothetical protein
MTGEFSEEGRSKTAVPAATYRPIWGQTTAPGRPSGDLLVESAPGWADPRHTRPDGIRGVVTSP